MSTDFVEQIAQQLITEIGPKVRATVEEASRREILSCTATQVLTFFASKPGEIIEPAASPQYLKALYCFARGQQYEGGEIDSIVTVPIVKATENALVEVLNSSDVRDLVVKTVTTREDVSSTVKGVLGGESKWIASELLETAGISPLGFASDQIAQHAATAASDLLASTTGKAIIAAIAKVALTTQGKLLLAKVITTVVAKVAASTALKVMVVSALKKIGVAFLIKAVLVKLLATALPALVAAKIPIFWILLPILGAFIYYEMKHIPDKLAAKIPPQIGAEVERSFPELAHKFAEMIVADMMKELVQQAERSA